MKNEFTNFAHKSEIILSTKGVSTNMQEMKVKNQFAKSDWMLDALEQNKLKEKAEGFGFLMDIDLLK